jgi:hypothetical protein
MTLRGVRCTRRKRQRDIGRASQGVLCAALTQAHATAMSICAVGAGFGLEPLSISAYPLNKLSIFHPLEASLHKPCMLPLEEQEKDGAPVGRGHSLRALFGKPPSRCSSRSVTAKRSSVPLREANILKTRVNQLFGLETITS